MRHVKIYDEKLPAEVLVTHTNKVTGKEETHHYCFRANKSKSYLICYMVDGEKVKQTFLCHLCFQISTFPLL